MINGVYAVDFQVHSFRSHDGKASIDQQCQRAVVIGLDEIGFTEHKDFDPSDPVVNHFDYESYICEIEKARHKYSRVLKIRAGVEIDYQKWFEDKISAYLEDHRFDFVMGSVHYVDRVKVMSHQYNTSRTMHHAYADYFEAVTDSIKYGKFDILGHLEYANRAGIGHWGKYDMKLYRAELEELLKTLISSKTILEINTAGLFHGTGATYPCRQTVELYAALGGKEISIGSDAHHPDQLGNFYAEAIKIAKISGINTLVVWEGGRKILMDI